MSIKRKAKEYFSFNKKEKRALLILSALIVLLSISPQIYLLFNSEDKVDNHVFEEGVKKFYAGQNKTPKENGNSNKEIIKEYFASNTKTESIIVGKKITKLFSFDPNTSNENDFAKLGLESRTIKSIINYRNKGGHFKSPEDFKKIYTLSEEDFNRVKDFIVINNSIHEKNKTEQKTFASYQTKIIDINTADSLEWVKLYGIGPYITSNILEYKNKLGGFYTVNQINEVFGMKPETFELIKNKIKCADAGGATIIQINMNTATKDELNNHPYISYKQATTIVNFRTQHGAFNSVNDLLNIDCFNDQEFNKIKYYLTIKSKE